MNKSSMQSEENFWPSVSDMFLSLFIIALVLYAGANDRSTEGDIMIRTQTVEEAIELIEQLQVAERLKEDEEIKSLSVEEIKKEREDCESARKAKDEGEEEKIRWEEIRSLPKLCEQLRKILHADKLSDYFEQSISDDQDGDEEYKNVVELLYNAGPAKDESRSGKLTTDAQLRKVRIYILKCVNTGRHSDLSPEELRQRLLELENTLAQREAELKKTIAEKEKLQEENKRLSDLLSINDKNLLKEIEKLQKELAKAKKKIEELQKKLDGAQEEMGTLVAKMSKDPRKEVMERVEELAKEIGLEGVEFDKQLGIMRIPAGIVSFMSGAPKAVTKLQDFIDPQKLDSTKKNLDKISALLEKIAKENEQKKWIDNIVIEGHSDITGRSNDYISSMRAVGIWLYLNGDTKGEPNKLSRYKNKDGNTLFSHAGYGSRSPLTREEGETDAAYNERCRRIDIRFNCRLNIEPQGTAKQ